MEAIATQRKPQREWINPAIPNYWTLTPLSIGVDPIFPLPTWKERVFKPSFYDAGHEQGMLAINTIIIAAFIVVFALIWMNYTHPVIRASTPSFCSLVILGKLLGNVLHFCIYAWIFT